MEKVNWAKENENIWTSITDHAGGYQEEFKRANYVVKRAIEAEERYQKGFGGN